LKILSGKIVVGHAIHNDFRALQYFHPKSLTRDTSQIPLLNRKASCPENITMSLKHLTKKLLNQDIQVASSSVPPPLPPHTYPDILGTVEALTAAALCPLIPEVLCH
jgi:K+-transporting ATPase c subunit